MNRRDGLGAACVLASLGLFLVIPPPVAAGPQPTTALNERLVRSPAAVATSADGAWFELTISPRQRHAAIFDPVRGRMIVFGGLREPVEPFQPGSAYYLSDLWELHVDGPLMWRKLLATGAPPGGRYGHSAVYDPVRNRMLVWGGLGTSGGDAGVYVLSLADSPSWAVLAASGTPPTGRYGHTAIYDPVRDRMLVFGGREGGSNRNDVWALTLSGSPAWSLVTTSGTPPSARQRHSAIYDPVRDRMIVFGGRGASALNDVWALSLAGSPAWSPLAPTGTPPSARSDHAAVYDPAGDRMVVFGGGNLNDVWTLSLSGTPVWGPATPAGAVPAARSFHTAVLDPTSHSMVVFAGVSGDVVSDVQVLSLSAPMQWVVNPFDETGPGPRYGHVSIQDPVRSRLLVFGGWGNSATSTPSTVWSLSLTGERSWTALTPTGTPPPIGLTEMSAIYDPVRDRMLVFGGYDGTMYNETWALSLADPPAWALLSPTGTRPSARMGHTAIYDPVRDRMVVHGGNAGSEMNDVYALSLAGTPGWTQLSPSGTPPPAQYDHAVIYDAVRDQMVRLQGWSSGSSFTQHALSLADPPAWASLSPSGSGSGGYGLGAVYDPIRDRMITVGGRSVMSSGEFIWSKALALAAPLQWTSPTPDGPLPVSRAQHGAAYDPVHDGVLVFGGQPAGSVGFPILGDVWMWAFIDPVIVPPDPWPHVNRVWLAAPNPTSESTTISFLLGSRGRIRVEVCDVTGRHVRSLLDEERPAGAGAVVWNGANDAGTRQHTGVYFVRFSAPGLRETRRVVLLR